MKQRALVLFLVISIVPTISFGACSVNNMTKCLDSVCAINIGSNPAARCQYCGMASAGDPTKSVGGMKTISAGSKYTLSEKELKKAPTDPGERYVWARQKCYEKVSGCDKTSEDEREEIEESYDKLIQQSCTAAGISADMAKLSEKVNKEKTKHSCNSDIKICLMDNKHCSANYANCEAQADFDKHFADCGVLSTGCEKYLSDIRSELLASRNSAIENADKLLAGIVEAYKQQRTQKLNSTNESCKTGSAKKACVETVCKNNMRHQCEVGYEYEQGLAEQLCKFYDIACERLK